jgi:hypothetical protein
MNFLSKFPESRALLAEFPDMEVLEVNAHVHTPYSFSAFADVPEIFDRALAENIAVLGIKDFFVTDGYETFCNQAVKSGIFPLFNVEFIGLLKDEQQQGIRINDPANPGRCYFSGKGLNYPFHAAQQTVQKLQHAIHESQDQVKAMIEKANNWFHTIQAGISLNYSQIKTRYAQELVRERHVAKAIRIAVEEKYLDDDVRKAFYKILFNGKPLSSNPADIPGIENEIRANLLKSGGMAFIEEKETAFMPLEQITGMILDAGGIPCYPVLLDDKNGQYTEYEKDPAKLWKELTERQIACIELIPGRNDASHLAPFMDYFNKRDFIVLLGTEHNTPDMIPLTCDTRGKKPLDLRFKRISYEGACVVAAHQYLQARGKAGFTGNNGEPRVAEKHEFISLGNAVIHYFRQYHKNIPNG